MHLFCILDVSYFTYCTWVEFLMLKLCLTSLGLGVGLAMDACAVSMTNGLNEPTMKKSKAFFFVFYVRVFSSIYADDRLVVRYFYCGKVR